MIHSSLYFLLYFQDANFLFGTQSASVPFLRLLDLEQRRRYWFRVGGPRYFLHHGRFSDDLCCCSSVFSLLLELLPAQLLLAPFEGDILGSKSSS